MRSKFLILAFFSLLILVGCSQGPSYPGGGIFPLPSSVRTRPSGEYCLYPDEWEAIKSQPVAFYCDRTEPMNCDPADPNCQWEVVGENIPYVLAASDVVVEKTYRGDQKQLILKERCPHPDTPPSEAKDYYTWKCHPISWGSWGNIYSITLWKNLSRPGDQKLQDGDHFNIYLRQDAQIFDSLICKDGTAGLEAVGGGVFLASSLEGEIITINIDGEEKRAMWFF